MLKYAIYPGYVRSRSDGQRHFIGGEKLARLYGLEPGEYKIFKGIDGERFPTDLVELHPRQDGDYTLPGEITSLVKPRAKTLMVTEFAEQNRELKPGTLTGRYKGDRVYPLMHNFPVMLPRDEAVVPLGTDFIQAQSRLHRPVEAISKVFTIQIKAVDGLTRSLNKVSKQLRYNQLAAHYGSRIATLMTSDDPRQRKRGKRLHQKRIGGLFARYCRSSSYQEAKESLDRFRSTFPEIRDFWNTKLGEIYTPEKYRKD